MNDSRISVRYSRALFQLALDRGILDKVNEDMTFIAEICKAPETKDLLHSPVIVPSKKTAIFHALLEENVEDITLSLIDLTIKNGRESFIPDIARSFLHDTLRHRGITDTLLVTAVPVNDALKEEIRNMVASVFNTKVNLRESVDPAIIGGFVLRIDDSFIDASIRNKLRKIKKDLKGSIAAS